MAGVLSLTLMAAWVRCVEWPVNKAPTATGESSHFGDKPVQLEDGRRVLVKFTKKGLVERHQDAKGRPWSRPRVLYPKGETPNAGSASARTGTPSL